MSNDIMYVIIKSQVLKTNDIQQLANQFCEYAVNYRRLFNIRIQGKETCLESEEMKQENKEITITIDCWDFKFERKEGKKEYHLKEIEPNYLDFNMDLKWGHIALLNTIMLDFHGEILWIAIDDGWFGYMYKLENDSLEVKEFSFYEVLKEGIVWGEKFKDVENAEEHILSEGELYFV